MKNVGIMELYFNIEKRDQAGQWYVAKTYSLKGITSKVVALFAAIIIILLPSVAKADIVSPTQIGITVNSKPAPNVTREANQLLAAQLADTFTTFQFLKYKNTFERDPLARFSTHSEAVGVVSAVELNIVARTVFHRSPTILRALTAVEFVFVVNNARVIGHARSGGLR